VPFILPQKLVGWAKSPRKTLPFRTASERSPIGVGDKFFPRGPISPAHDRVGKGAPRPDAILKAS
jgi:hypothetical protein